MPLPADLDPRIDLICEAAVVPEIWPDVLERIAAATGPVGRVILAQGRHGRPPAPEAEHETRAIGFTRWPWWVRVVQNRSRYGRPWP